MSWLTEVINGLTRRLRWIHVARSRVWLTRDEVSPMTRHLRHNRSVNRSATCEWVFIYWVFVLQMYKPGLRVKNYFQIACMKVIFKYVVYVKPSSDHPLVINVIWRWNLKVSTNIKHTNLKMSLVQPTHYLSSTFSVYRSIDNTYLFDSDPVVKPIIDFFCLQINW